MRRFEEIAVDFASALVAGEFERARALLSPALQTVLSAAELRDRLFAMFEGYADCPPTSIHFDDEFSLVEWPSKQPGDLGLAYVGIHGAGFVEAVTVTVSAGGGQTVIREIEWGRP